MSPGVRNRVLVATVLLLVGVGYLLTNRSGQDSDAPSADASEDQQDTAGSAPADASNTSTPEAAAAGQPEGSGGLNSDDEAAGDVLQASPTPAEPQDSPFAVTDAEPDAAGDQASVTTDLAAQPGNPARAAEPSGAESTVSSSAVRQPGEVIAVPDSYPITEAARYFVPREERRPGNLGGPPPLDFPGGPNDPNRPGDDALALPPAPGQ